MGLSKQIVYIRDFLDEAKLLRSSFGRTTLFSTGHPTLDSYLGGGFGRADGYEIVLLYGETGVGKSTVALNFLVPAILQNKHVGLLVLEDAMADISLRFEQMLSPSEYRHMNQSDTVLCLPPDALVKSWTLNDLLKYIEDWFTVMKCDLILLDHLQFAFENAEAVRGENEYVAQRVFMQKLNQLVKRINKTIILISHVSKTPAKGMNKIAGSGALAQAATKVIEIRENAIPGTIDIQLHKTRFTRRPNFHFCMKLVDTRMETAA